MKPSSLENAGTFRNKGFSGVRPPLTAVAKKIAFSFLETVPYEKKLRLV